MIHSFRFKNFCSFADDTTISFEVARKGVETQNNMFCDTQSGARLSKVVLVAGPNASGKTNALKSLFFLSWFAGNSFVQLQGEELIPVDRYAFSDDKKEASEFELVFEHESTIYKYVLHLLPTHVVKEELYRKEETQHFNYLFKRSWDNEKNTSDIVVQHINLKVDVLKDILRKNVSLISAAVAIKDETLTSIAGFLAKIISNVYRMGKSWDTASLGDQRLFEAADKYQKDEDLFKKVVQFLKDMDLGLDDVLFKVSEMRGPKGETKLIHVPFGIHKVNNKKYDLPFALESSGTKNMFVLLHFLLPAIAQGGIAVIDELEIDLHPHALPQIIELFANKSTNPKNSQLLFTSHSLEILNHLEKEQVIFAEKKDCHSELYRLDELKGVRRDDNIYAKYMAGAYGAVPNL